MTRQKQAFTALKMGTKWSLSPKATATPATGVEESTSSSTERSRSLGLKGSDSPYELKMIGHKVLMEEEPMEAVPDAKSGLTKEVCEAISEGRLVLSDQSEYALYKYPYKGTVLSVGERCKYIKVGDRVHFAPLGVQRFEFRGKQFLITHEADVHGTYAS